MLGSHRSLVEQQRGRLVRGPVRFSAINPVMFADNVPEIDDLMNINGVETRQLVNTPCCWSCIRDRLLNLKWQDLPHFDIRQNRD